MDATLEVGAASTLRLVNGVFMGGGAKSIAYGGAVRAVRERGMWFGSVAGSSAGAITSALIASGLGPQELEAAIPAGLAAARSPIASRAGKVIIGHAHSVFEGRGLRAWLDDVMARQVGKTDGRPVTFSELYDASGIELYVVTVDLANGLPIVFCRRTTPMVDVAGAVVASAAIPGAFPAGRAVLQRDDRGALVHALIDGSAWASYPSFVFQDRSFRAWLRAEAQISGVAGPHDDAGVAVEDERPLIGFTLGDPEPLERLGAVAFVPSDGPDINRRFDRGPTFTSPKRFSYLFGSLLSSDWARMIFAVALLIWLSLSIVTLPIGFRRFAGWLAGWMPDPLYPFALVGGLSVVVVAMMSAITMITVALLAGRVIADTVLPSAKAVLGVPMEVPPWIGLGEDSVVLHVPDDGLQTVDFGVAPDICAAAIELAHGSVEHQLDDPFVVARLDALFRGEPAEPSPPRRGTRPEAVAPFDERVSLVEIVLLVAVAGAVGALAWAGTNLAGTDRTEWILLVIVVGLIAVGVAVWYVGGRAARRAAGRATTGIGSAPLLTTSNPKFVIAGGLLLLLVGFVLSTAAMDGRSGNTVEGQVIEAAEGSSSNTYVVELTGDRAGEDVNMVVDRHLRLGESVFVDPDTGELVGALDDPLFGVAVVSWVLAFGVITSGVRSLRWTQRCRHLTELVTDRTSG